MSVVDPHSTFDFLPVRTCPSRFPISNLTVGDLDRRATWASYSPAAIGGGGWCIKLFVLAVVGKEWCASVVTGAQVGMAATVPVLLISTSVVRSDVGRFSQRVAGDVRASVLTGRS